MKKRIFLAACLMLTMSAGLMTSCNEDETMLQISEELATKGIETDMSNKLIEIPVNSNTEWELKLESECDWLEILTPKGKGDSKVLISIDDNATRLGRSAMLVLTAGDKEQKIRVVQGTSDANSGNASTQFASAKTNYGLGVGVDITEDGCIVKNAVVNIATVRKMMAEDADMELGDMLSITKYTTANLHEAIVDSIEQKMDSLGVHFGLDISFSKFKFAVSGNVTSNEVLKDSMFHYTTGAKYSLASSSYDLSTICAAFDADKDDLSASLYSLKSSLFPLGFKNARNAVIKAYGTSSFEQRVKDLVSKYGTFVTEQTEVGGSALLDGYVDAIYSIDTLRIDKASIVLELQASLSVKASGQVDYNKTSNDILKHSNYNLNIVGGPLDKVVAVTRALENIRKVGDDEAVKNVQQTMNDWLLSLNADMDQASFNCNVIGMQLYPIWFFFDDEMSDAVKDVILEMKKGIKEYDIYK